MEPELIACTRLNSRTGIPEEELDELEELEELDELDELELLLDDELAVLADPPEPPQAASVTHTNAVVQSLKAVVMFMVISTCLSHCYQIFYRDMLPRERWFN